MIPDLFAEGKLRRTDCPYCGFFKGGSIFGCRCRQAVESFTYTYGCTRCPASTHEAIFGTVLGVRLPFCSRRCLLAAQRAVRGRRATVKR